MVVNKDLRDFRKKFNTNLANFDRKYENNYGSLRSFMDENFGKTKDAIARLDFLIDKERADRIK